MENTRISILVKKTSLAFDKLSNQLLTPYDLTGSQFKILMVLYKSTPCSVRQADIEALFSMSNPTVTGLVQKLEAKDLVRRIPHPDDKRSRVLMLTDRALTLKEELLTLSDNMEKQMTANLTEDEYNQLASLLKKMLEIE